MNFIDICAEKVFIGFCTEILELNRHQSLKISYQWSNEINCMNFQLKIQLNLRHQRIFQWFSSEVLSTVCRKWILRASIPYTRATILSLNLARLEGSSHIRIVSKLFMMMTKVPYSWWNLHPKSESYIICPQKQSLVMLRRVATTDFTSQIVGKLNSPIANGSFGEVYRCTVEPSEGKTEVSPTSQVHECCFW